MTLQIVVGDVFNAIMEKDCVFCHGVNCSGGFGSGVAGIVKRLYPHAALKYAQVYRRHGIKLGQIIICPKQESQPTIVHCATQQNYGRDGKKYADYDAVIVSLQEVVKTFPDKPIILPLIGGGLGGLDKKRLIAIFQEVFYNVDATLYLTED